MHLFNISGRSGRMEYLLHTVFDVIFIFAMVFVLIFLNEYFDFQVNENALLASITFIVVFGAVVEFCATIRRFHDINMSGWMLLLSLIPIANIVIGFMLLFKRGDEGVNRYGGPPN